MNSLVIDEEGYFLSQGVRLQEAEYGNLLLRNLLMDERGRASTRDHTSTIQVEPFDEPYVALMVEKINDVWWAQMPYGFRQAFDLQSITADDWDRFHGLTKNGVPFVMSRPAQAAFFNRLDDYDDESLTDGGQRFVVGPWLSPTADVHQAQFWSEIYLNESPGWELGEAAAPLREILPQLKLPRSRVLVLGCGSGNDAAHFAEQGHLVTAVDFSEQALGLARKKYGHLKDLSFEQANALHPPSHWFGRFDLIFEHTLYCAIPPVNRADLVKVWHRCLQEGGHLLGLFFVMNKRFGPPWGGSEWEIRERLKKSFEFRYWTRWQRSIEKRRGTELVVYAQRRSF